jgi:formylglycine-generating enzyme required for sulfatase activity
VGLLKSNDLGLFDMHGNNWEWTQDAWKPYSKGEKATDDIEDTNKISFATNRVLRGGSFNCEDWLCRSAVRFSYAPDSRIVERGFRVAITLPSRTP